MFEEIISEWDYCKILKFYNRKSLASTISGLFNFSNNELQNLIIRKLWDKDIKKLVIEWVKKYIPSELVSKI